MLYMDTPLLPKNDDCQQFTKNFLKFLIFKHRFL